MENGFIEIIGEFWATKPSLPLNVLQYVSLNKNYEVYKYVQVNFQ